MAAAASTAIRHLFKRTESAGPLVRTRRELVSIETAIS
jgi:hypothetical protein